MMNREFLAYDIGHPAAESNQKSFVSEEHLAEVDDMLLEALLADP